MLRQSVIFEARPFYLAFLHLQCVWSSLAVNGISDCIIRVIAVSLGQRRSEIVGIWKAYPCKSLNQNEVLFKGNGQIMNWYEYVHSIIYVYTCDSTKKQQQKSNHCVLQIGKFTQQEVGNSKALACCICLGKKKTLSKINKVFSLILLFLAIFELPSVFLILINTLACKCLSGSFRVIQTRR